MAWYVCLTMKTKSLSAAQQRPAPAEQTAQIPQVEPPLSPQLGFVVQFRIRVGQPESYFAGRAEHLISGRSAHFHSPAELMVFLVRELGPGKEGAGSGNADISTA
jgi:hypothetical protein